LNLIRATEQVQLALQQTMLNGFADDPSGACERQLEVAKERMQNSQHLVRVALNGLKKVRLS
jgi:hypothetical protein